MTMRVKLDRHGGGKLRERVRHQRTLPRARALAMTTRRLRKRRVGNIAWEQLRRKRTRRMTMMTWRVSWTIRRSETSRW